MKHLYAIAMIDARMAAGRPPRVDAASLGADS